MCILSIARELTGYNADIYKFLDSKQKTKQSYFQQRSSIITFFNKILTLVFQAKNCFSNVDLHVSFSTSSKPKKFLFKLAIKTV